jgi:hypothetical protein
MKEKRLRTRTEQKLILGRPTPDGPERIPAARLTERLAISVASIAMSQNLQFMATIFRYSPI